MTSRARLLVFLAILLVVVGATTAYAIRAARQHDRAFDGPPSVATAPDAARRTDLGSGGRIVFRHTGLDDHFGRVAAVPLADPGGSRAFTGADCDRVHATRAGASCLRVQRGVVTGFDLVEMGPDWSTQRTVGVPGLPSRTRLSPDGSLVALTTFVTGHSYEQAGFSTATEVREVGGQTLGTLEEFALVIDGRQVSPRDRNLWGVTFAADDDTFYATAATGGRTFLVRGDLSDRTLTSVRENAECPSLSPDGTTVAYKVDTGERGARWSIAVLDLATGRQTILRGERGNVDDQVEWLDDDTVLYGLPRVGEAGVTDVWSIDTDADARPSLLIEQAWSPAVVR